MEEGADVNSVINGIVPTFANPLPPADSGTSKAAEIIYRMDLKNKVWAQQTLYCTNLSKTFAIIFGICSENLPSTLENTDGFDDLQNSSEAFGLLAMLKWVVRACCPAGQCARCWQKTS
jgi:hypothetical protein